MSESLIITAVLVAAGLIAGSIPLYRLIQHLEQRMAAVDKELDLLSEGWDLRFEDSLKNLDTALSKRIRKLEQKDGQTQNWINTTITCFENHQDQIDTLRDTVYGKGEP